MAGVRVYQLAKELQVQSALILEVLDRLGREVRSDLSPLDEETANLVRVRLIAALDVERKRLARERAEHEHDADADVPALDILLEAGEPTERPIEPAAAMAGAVHESVTAAEMATQPEGAPTAPSVEQPAETLAAAPAAAAPAPATPLAASAPHAAATPTPMPRPAGASQAATATEGPRGPRVFAARRTVPLMTRPSARPTGPRVGAPPSGVRTGSPLSPSRPDPGRPGGLARPGMPPPTPPPGSRPAPAGARPPGARPVFDRTERRRKGNEPPVPMPSARIKPDLPPVPEKITLSETVTVKELAEKLNRKSKDVIAKLISRGVLANINQPLDPQMAIEVAKEFGSDATIMTFEEEQRQEAPATETTVEESAEKLRTRPPVVTVMGHVDHGKTSLLDAIRTTNVVSSEFGGITQHIGAYQVEEKGRKITFLDTPGHEAFTMMRARGARVTDIVVLVVAADDGVKPQTLEAIDHAKAAGVPMVVAINKIDKPDARPDRVKQQLADHGVLIEEYGGQTVCCAISAKKRTGIQELLDMILLVADIGDLKANADKPASGVVLEARLDRARGIVATILVQAGTLRVGDPFLAGTAYGKVRAMTDEHGRRIETVGPSTPVEVMGFQSEPVAGDLYQGVTDEQKARQIAQFRQEKARAATLAKSSRRTLESLSRDIAEGVAKEMQVLLKTDVQGSLEALQQAIGELPKNKVKVEVLRAGTGAITQADVLLASASNAIVVGFNVRPDRATAELARQEEVELRLYTIIYDVVNDLRAAMVGLLEPTLKESVLGQAEVRQIFRVPKVGVVCGCMVTEGTLKRSADVRLIRDNVVIYTGKVGSLRRFKDDVSEVKSGFECGIGIANFNDLKEGDVIEFFVIEKIAAQSL